MGRNIYRLISEEDRKILDKRVIRTWKYDQEISLTDMSTRFGISAYTIRDILKKAGIYERRF